MRLIRFIIFIVIVVSFSSSIIIADEIRPGYLQLKELSSQNWEVLWKIPAKGQRKLALQVEFPKGCEENNRGSRLTNGAYIERWRLKCSEKLVDKIIHISGLSDTRTDVLAHIVRIDGTGQTTRLTPSQTSFVIKSKEGWIEVAATYLTLGFEHILLGFDHLLFVLGLLFLVGSWGRLVATITTFTIAHSFTLAAASFGWASVPQAPVEALIALSIVFVAVEILHARQGKRGIAIRMPWMIAFLFGLLHGFGFAGALSEIGLPAHAIPLALLFFNIGVELGQLAFVAGVFGLGIVFTYLMRQSKQGVNVWKTIGSTAFPVAYFIGTLAMFWVFERTYSFIA